MAYEVQQMRGEKKHRFKDTIHIFDLKENGGNLVRLGKTLEDVGLEGVKSRAELDLEEILWIIYFKHFIPESKQVT